MFSELAVKISADIKDFEKGFKSLEGSLDKISKGIGDTGKSMTKFVTGPILAVGGGLLALATKTGDFADRILDLSEITGMSTDAIQEFQNVAKIAGVDTETVTRAVEGLTKKMAPMMLEANQAKDAFDKLGISFEEFEKALPDDRMDLLYDAFQKLDAKNLTPEIEALANSFGLTGEQMVLTEMGLEDVTGKLGTLIGRATPMTLAMKKLGLSMTDMLEMTPDEKLDVMIKKLAENENVTERNTIGSQLFGGAWKDLAPILALGTEGIDEARKAAHEMGIVMGDDALNKANDFRIGMENLKTEFMAAGQGIMTEFIPILTDDLMPFITDTVVPKLREFAEMIRSLFERFKELSPQTKKIIGIFIAVAAAIGPALVVFGKLIGVFALLLSPIGLIVLAIAGITAAIIYLYQTNEEFANFVLEVWEKIQIAFEFLAEIFKKLITGDIKGAIMEFENMLFGMTMISQDNIYKITEFLLNLKEIFVSLGKMIKSVIQGDIESAFHIFTDNILSMFIKCDDVLYEIGELFYTFEEIFFKVVEGIGEIIEERFIPLLQKIEETFMMIVDAVKPILLDMLAFIGEIFMTIVEFWNENGAQLIDAVLNITNFIVGLFTIFANVIMDIVKFFLPFITGLFEVAWRLIKDIFNNTLKVILGIFKLFIGIFTGDWRKAWQGIKDIFTGLLGNIVAVFKGILNSMINQINFFIGKINKLKIKVPSVKIPLVGEVGGFEIGIPNIPKIPFLAEGGLVTAPTLAMIAEDHNPEMVIPLNKIASLTNNKQTNIYLDGKQISNVVAPHMVDTLRTKLAY